LFGAQLGDAFHVFGFHGLSRWGTAGATVCLCCPGPRRSVVYEIPVPGIRIVVRTPLFPNVTQAPRLPSDMEAPYFEILSRTPGSTLNERRKRKPMFKPSVRRGDSTIEQDDRARRNRPVP
jgi:hypothetical protein